jgi:pilus assembly protein TadC
MVVDAAHHRGTAVNALTLSTIALVLVTAPAVPRPSPRRPTPADGVRPTPRPAGERPHHVVPLGPLLTRFRCAPARRRRRRAVAEAMPDVIEMLVLVVHAGASPAHAVTQVRPLLDHGIRPAFDAVVHRLQRGQRLADAVAALPEHLGHHATGLADAIAAADRYGLALGPVLDALADDARADRRRVGEAHARSLSVKLSFPLVVCTLPAFVLIAIVPAVLGSLASLPDPPSRP